ncbi:MAG: hypothetical protein M3O50_21635, partial [Myxococcota bacterium]|nr:hypothetical protein [Myxococcota bacterium]
MRAQGLKTAALLVMVAVMATSHAFAQYPAPPEQQPYPQQPQYPPPSQQQPYPPPPQQPYPQQQPYPPPPQQPYP